MEGDVQWIVIKEMLIKAMKTQVCDLDAGLFAHLAPQGILYSLAEFDPATGQGIRAGVDGVDQQDLAVLPDDGIDRRPEGQLFLRHKFGFPIMGDALDHQGFTLYIRQVDGLHPSLGVALDHPRQFQALIALIERTHLADLGHVTGGQLSQPVQEGFIRPP